MSVLRSYVDDGRPQAMAAGSLLERILLTKAADLDALCERPEVRTAIDGFSTSYLLVALPKSSSTYSTQALARILDAEVYKDIVTQDRFTPKDLSVAGIVNVRDKVTISQVHLVASGANLRMLQHFRLPIAILLRNLFDVVVSLRDHMNGNQYFSSILIPNAYDTLPDEDKLDYIIDTAVPWMITFYVSWVQAISRRDVDTEFVFYEDMVSDPTGFFRRICARFGRTVSEADVRTALDCVEKSAVTRYNIGKPGRGMLELSAAQIARIRRHADYYPGIDFRPLGL
ncbi:MAG: hypothetical protein AB7V13_10690 [Pseudorhodoplanes sp.]|uniref:hypothetical protein n=1 Tax=Pseudorhodoplanes sp. TaxID=1934341 RepID=UPI003D0F8377